MTAEKPKYYVAQRGNYDSILNFNFGKAEKFAVLYGVTGSGKTTYTLAPILDVRHNLRVVLVQPTDGNVASAANGLLEVKANLRRFVPFVPDIVPIHQHVLFSGPGLGIIPAKEFVRRIYNAEFLQKFDLFIIDEYHILNPLMTEIRLASVTLDNFPKVLNVSATPIGVTPPKTINTKIHTELADLSLALIPADFPTFRRSAYNPYRYWSGTNGIILYVVPTLYYGETLYEQLQKLGTQPYFIHGDTPRHTADKTLRLIQGQNRCLIITPDLEAGLNLDLAVLIDPGYTNTLIETESVLYYFERPLTPSEIEQRKNRLGRKTEGLYVQNSQLPPGKVDVDISAIELQVAIKIFSTSKRPDSSFIPNANKKYPFLKSASFTADRCREALAKYPNDPVLGYFLLNRDGQETVVKDPSNPPVEDDLLRHCKLYTWTNGYLLTSVLDLTNPQAKPWECLNRLEALALVDMLLVHHGLDYSKQTIDDLVKIVVKHIDFLRDQVFAVIASVLASVVEYKWYNIIDTKTKKKIPASKFRSIIFKEFEPVVIAMLAKPTYRYGYTEDPVDATKKDKAHFYLSRGTTNVKLNFDGYIQSGQKGPDLRQFQSDVFNAMAPYLKVALLADKSPIKVNLYKYSTKMVSPYLRHQVRSSSSVYS